MLFEMKQVSKIYGTGDARVEALKEITLSIEEGSSVSVMGKSGSGKSTLLHLIGGVDFPSEGEILFQGKAIQRLGDKELSAYRREQIGFVFQDFKLLPELNVAENITLPLVIAKKKIDWDYIHELVAVLGISDKIKNHPEQLSGGQRQRVAIARAIVHNPRMILCDEPTGALDVDTSEEIMQLLQRLKESGKTLIIVTHDKKVADYCERRIILSDGMLVPEK